MWVAKYEQSTAVTRTGTISATWTDPLDATSSFSYSEPRVNEGTNLSGFVTRAKAALSAWQTQQAQLKAISDRITSALNS